MIECYSLSGEFYESPECFTEFNEIKNKLDNGQEDIKDFPIEAIISLIDEYSKKISRDRELLREEGVAFLTFYLKKNNINKMVDLNIGNKDYLNTFVDVGNGKYMKAQRRGLICHWIAGNVGTLGVYSLVQSLLCRNSNLIRVPKELISITLGLLKPLKEVQVNLNGIYYKGEDLLKAVSIVYFKSDNIKLNNAMSSMADARIFWGGEEALNSVKKLTQKTTCKDIVFGPKYSFAVMDKEAVESIELEKYLERLVMDIITFNQKACSSPHVVFIEKSIISLDEVCNRFVKVFNKISRKYPVKYIDQGAAAKIINKRGEYGLSLDKMIYNSKCFNYTILVNDNTALEDPIGYRTVFLKEVSDVFDIKNLITSKIQTIGIAFSDKNKALSFTEEVTQRGVDRVIALGSMNIYDYPWDGMMVIHELLRWCSLSLGESL
ncbi:hypothetical protein JOC70_001847 [Clostridium pascui]|uniref:acyl-CoA reductase n=1 Tax=Clostridium pascui TaxID=46609 RepID=UPI00195AA207|nr:acyl-CoA reductase [Clostridium pascui]MBM7870362.1 hypothetical protein [Clostridium pascui]